MLLADQIEEWKLQLELQNNRKLKAQETLKNAQAIISEADQQILLLTGGLTFAQNLDVPTEATKAIKQPQRKTK